MTKKIMNFYGSDYHTRSDFEEKFHKHEAATQPVLHELHHVLRWLDLFQISIK